MLSSLNFYPIGMGEGPDIWGKGVMSYFTKITQVAKWKKVCEWERKGKQGEQSGDLRNGPDKGQPGVQ